MKLFVKTEIQLYFCSHDSGAKKKPLAKRQKASKNPQYDRRRKGALRLEPQRHAPSKMGKTQKLSPLARLIQTLKANHIRFQLVGMSAAILQGVPASTLDTDLWVDLPSRQYMTINNLCLKLGATIIRNTVVLLKDESLVNFCYHIDGLDGFDREYAKAILLPMENQRVPVMPLQSILKSKQSIRRNKDLTHIQLIRQTLKCQKILG